MTKSVYVIHGINEGPAMSKKFRSACEAAGFNIAKDLDSADIIFAHSGGALLLPANTDGKRVFLAGLAYWPRKSWWSATTEHVGKEKEDFPGRAGRLALVSKWMHRAHYFFKFPTVVRMGRNQNMEAPWNNSGRQIIIRNRYDAYCTPDIFKMPFKGPRAFISLPGRHDDCWVNPTPYVSLLQSDV